MYFTCSLLLPIWLLSRMEDRILDEDLGIKDLSFLEIIDRNAGWRKDIKD